MRRLVCAFVVRKHLRQVFSCRGPYNLETTFNSCYNHINIFNLIFKSFQKLIRVMRKIIFTVCEKQNIDQSVYLYREYHFLDSMGLVTRKPVFGGLRTTKAQTSLHIRAVCSAPLLFAFLKAQYLRLLQAKSQFSS